MRLIEPPCRGPHRAASAWRATGSRARISARAACRRWNAISIAASASGAPSVLGSTGWTDAAARLAPCSSATDRGVTGGRIRADAEQLCQRGEPIPRLEAEALLAVAIAVDGSVAAESVAELIAERGASNWAGALLGAASTAAVSAAGGPGQNCGSLDWQPVQAYTNRIPRPSDGACLRLTIRGL